MKRLLTVLLAILLALTLTACKSENMKNAEALVAAIGEVTLGSGDAIAAAEEAMSLLTEKEREKFAESEGVLLIARATYDGLCVAQAVQTVESIGEEISFASEDAILAARELYDALPEELRDQVENADKLIAAEEAFAAYTAAVTAVEDQIAALGDVTLGGKEAVAAARAAFDALTAEQQDAVENADALDAAEQSLIALQEEVDAVESLIAALGEVTVESEADVTVAREAYDSLNADQQDAVEHVADLIAAEEALAGYAAEIAMVEEMIASIGEVSADNLTDIQATRAAYEVLADDLKPYVTNLTVLEEAENATLAVKADAIEAIIAAIPANPTASDIAAARSAYESAEAEVAALVENYAALEEAEASYILALEEQFLQKMASLFEVYGVAMPATDEEIDAAFQACVKKVDVESGELIAETRAAFRDLPAVSQEKYTLYDEGLAALETAVADAKAAACQAAIDALMKKMRVEEDRVQGYTWISSKTEPQYSDDRCFLLPYIGKSNAYGNYWMVIRYNYTEDDWVFFEKVIVVTDTNKYTFSVDYFDVMRDNDYGIVWEVYDDTAVSDADIAMLRDIASSSEVIVRFEGDDYYWDFTVPAKDKTAITEVVDLFEALTGK